MWQTRILPRYSTFLEFFGKGTQGGPCECSRPLAERSLRYPSYTNFRDRRPGAGLLIQTNRIGTTAVHLPRGGAAEGRAARRWRAPFRSTSLCAEEPAANDAAGPKNGQAGKVVPGGHWAASGADFRDQPPRARAVVAGRVPAKSRDPRRDFCPKPRPGEKRGPHIDWHPMGRCLCQVS